MARHFEAFDKLRTQGFFVGEMIWNFADFKTAQSKYKQIIYAQCGQFSHQKSWDKLLRNMSHLHSENC